MYKVLSLARPLGSVRKRSILLAVRLRRRIARVNRLLMRRVGSPRVFIGRLGLIITFVTIFAPPAAFLGVATLQLRQRAAEQATLGARHVEVQLTVSARRRLDRPGAHQRRACHPHAAQRRRRQLADGRREQDADVPRRDGVVARTDGEYASPLVAIRRTVPCRRLDPQRARRRDADRRRVPRARSRPPTSVSGVFPGGHRQCRQGAAGQNASSWKPRTCASMRRSTTCRRACACSTREQQAGRLQCAAIRACTP